MTFNFTNKSLKTRKGKIMLMTTIVALVCIPLFVTSLVYFKSSEMTDKNLKNHMDNFQLSIIEWNIEMKAKFINKYVTGIVTNSSDFKVRPNILIPLRATNEPTELDKLIQKKTGIYYDVHRYIGEIDYPEEDPSLNATGIYENGGYSYYYKQSPFKVVNFTSANITNHLNPFNVGNNKVQLANGTIKNICTIRYRGEWIEQDSICMVKRYSSMCFEREIGGFYYNRDRYFLDE